MSDWMTLIIVAAGLVYFMYWGTEVEPDDERYCPACKRVTPWHPKRGCSVCRTLDQCF